LRAEPCHEYHDPFNLKRQRSAQYRYIIILERLPEDKCLWGAAVLGILYGILAKGITLLAAQKVPDGEIIHNARITRCLFYVSDVLKQVLENGGIQVRRVKNSEMLPFALAYYQLLRT